MIGLWIYVFFRHGHPKLRNRPTILVSLESTGPYQRNGASLVFMCCVVLKIRDTIVFLPLYRPSYRKLIIKDLKNIKNVKGCRNGMPKSN